MPGSLARALVMEIRRTIEERIPEFVAVIYKEVKALVGPRSVGRSASVIEYNSCSGKADL